MARHGHARHFIERASEDTYVHVPGAAVSLGAVGPEGPCDLPGCPTCLTPWDAAGVQEQYSWPPGRRLTLGAYDAPGRAQPASPTHAPPSPRYAVSGLPGAWERLADAVEAAMAAGGEREVRFAGKANVIVRVWTPEHNQAKEDRT